MGWVLQEPERSGVRATSYSQWCCGLSGTWPSGCLRRMGANEEARSGSGEAKIISDPVVGAGSLSALIVLMTLGNAARADPAEGSGAP